jgi:hypothetical protein
MKPRLPVQIVDARTGETFDELQLDWTPHPGHCLEINSQLYTVLEKRHYYQLRDGRYQLCAIRAFVRPAPTALDTAAESGLAPRERSLVNGQWVVGDSTCRFNARSPLLRCALNPLGPCAGCCHFQSVDAEPEH